MTVNAKARVLRDKLANGDRQKLDELAGKTPQMKPLVDRLVGRPFFGNRPPAKDTDAWLKFLEGPADAQAGRRIFAHSSLVKNTSMRSRLISAGSTLFSAA